MFNKYCIKLIDFERSSNYNSLKSILIDMSMLYNSLADDFDYNCELKKELKLMSDLYDSEEYVFENSTTIIINYLRFVKNNIGKDIYEKAKKLYNFNIL